MENALTVVVVGCGNMGSAHARAYRADPGFNLVGLVDRVPELRRRLAADLGAVPEYDDLGTALAGAAPDCVAICTYPDTHAALTLQAFEAGCHVFVEKPIAATVAEAEAVVGAARRTGRKLVVGYILRHHPSWLKFIELARTLGKPLVMRMNLNQQSAGSAWATHKSLMQSMSPIVDCGVHYVDVMCQMTGSTPVRVSAIGARLTEDIPPGMYSYGQLQVVFADGSVGWYEAGWGPMMSETAFFVKDVVGPLGSVSITSAPGSGGKASADTSSHTKAESLLLHHAGLDRHGAFERKDEIVELADEPDHLELCAREQRYFRRAIIDDLDLAPHLADAVNSLRIVLAADESVRTGRTVELR
ncbi:MAG TPA: Gfo/Idh/MocA family oxidoreductase [Vicinamibacterales bacterium]|nr:Gfo/Idh/MocA family oxidoreductase [Vicinamibacterales bacterium]HOQ59904.1 Gfo/Idh/MocA family oxidoreductase [Vicinamibacterales bacterium]